MEFDDKKPVKILIAYYSHSGNNEKVAHELKNRTGESLYRIREKKKRKTISILFDLLFKRRSTLRLMPIDIKEFDKVIFVSPIWGGRIATPMRAFINEEQEYLNKYYFISVCNGEPGQQEAIIDELQAMTHRTPGNVTELSINSLLPAEKQHKVKYTFNYRIDSHDLQRFNDAIESFVKTVIPH